MAISSHLSHFKLVMKSRTLSIMVLWYKIVQRLWPTFIPWKTGTGSGTQTALIGCSLVTGSPCSPGSPKALQHPAAGFDMPCVRSHGSALTSSVYPNCEREKSILYSLLISANGEGFLSPWSVSCIFKVFSFSSFVECLPCVRGKKIYPETL